MNKPIHHSDRYYKFWERKLDILDTILRRDYSITVRIYMRYLSAFDIIYDNGSPKHCQFCGHDTFTQKIRDYINYTPAEVEYFCEYCNKSVAYWSYGLFQL